MRGARRRGVLQDPEAAVRAHDEVGEVDGPAAVAGWRGHRGREETRPARAQRPRIAAHEDAAHVIARPEIVERRGIGALDHVQVDPRGRRHPGEQGSPRRGERGAGRVHPGAADEGSRHGQVAARVDGAAAKHKTAHRTDKRCSLGALAARRGWATCGLPCGPQPDTRRCSLHRGEGERQHRDRPLTRAILRRHGLAVTKRAEGRGGGAGGGAAGWQG